MGKKNTQEINLKSGMVEIKQKENPKFSKFIPKIHIEV